MKKGQLIFNAVVIVLLALVCFSLGNAQPGTPLPQNRVFIQNTPIHNPNFAFVTDGNIHTQIYSGNIPLVVNQDGSVNVEVKNPIRVTTPSGEIEKAGGVNDFHVIPKTLVMCATDFSNTKQGATIGNVVFPIRPIGYPINTNVVIPEGCYQIPATQFVSSSNAYTLIATF